MELVTTLPISRGELFDVQRGQQYNDSWIIPDKISKNMNKHRRLDQTSLDVSTESQNMTDCLESDKRWNTMAASFDPIEWPITRCAAVIR